MKSIQFLKHIATMLAIVFTLGMTCTYAQETNPKSKKTEKPVPKPKLPMKPADSTKTTPSPQKVDSTIKKAPIKPPKMN